MLNADVHPLFDVAVADDLLDNNTDGIWCHVVDNTSSSARRNRPPTEKNIIVLVNMHPVRKFDRDMCAPVVVFVGHTLLLSRIGLNINDIADTVGDEVRRQLDGTMLCNTRQSSTTAYVQYKRIILIPLKPRLNMSRVRAR